MVVRARGVAKILRASPPCTLPRAVRVVLARPRGGVGRRRAVSGVPGVPATWGRVCVGSCRRAACALRPSAPFFRAARRAQVFTAPVAADGQLARCPAGFASVARRRRVVAPVGGIAKFLREFPPFVSSRCRSSMFLSPPGVGARHVRRTAAAGSLVVRAAVILTRIGSCRRATVVRARIGSCRRATASRRCRALRPCAAPRTVGHWAIREPQPLVVFAVRRSCGRPLTPLPARVASLPPAPSLSPPPSDRALGLPSPTAAIASAPTPALTMLAAALMSAPEAITSSSPALAVAITNARPISRLPADLSRHRVGRGG